MPNNNYFDFLPPKLSSEVQKSLHSVLEALQPWNGLITAVVLGGGWKNQEVYYKSDQAHSDLDVFVISNWLPWIWKRLTKISTKLNANQINPEIHLRGAIPFLLGRSRTFWAYKLKQEGIVLYGNQDILERIQANSHNIPKTEAIRMLFQILITRLIPLQIDKLSHTAAADSIARTYLNIGEAYLTYWRALAPSYGERRNAFMQIKDQVGLPAPISQKIEMGYNLKSIWHGELPNENNLHLNLDQAKRDCLTAINHLLADYLRSSSEPDDLLNQLQRDFPRRWLLNILFYYATRKIAGVHPKFLPLIFKFNIIELYKMAWYHATQQWDKRDAIAERYWQIDDFSGDVLTKLHQLWPVPVTVEIK